MADSVLPAEGPVLVSACLAGRACTYKGASNDADPVRRLVEQGRAVLVCPEEDGGLPTPRPPAEIHAGTGEHVLDGTARVATADGDDVTPAFLRGAEIAVALARDHEVTGAVLKARSPSCGCGEIYDGTFSRILRTGDGVTAAALRRAGVLVITEEDLDE